MKNDVNPSSRVETRRNVRLSPRVLSVIAALRRSGGNGALIADKAQAVIEALKEGAGPEAVGRIAPRTAHGEKRIRKCIKYDLGWGYRLITLLRRRTLFICQLGPHDACDRWLEENRRAKSISMPGALVFDVALKAPGDYAAAREGAPGAAEDPAEPPMALTEKQLRRIFCGLVAARRKPDENYRFSR